MHSNFEYITTLQYRNQALEKKVRSLESGEKYVQLQTDYQKLLSKKEREICDLKTELEQAHRTIHLIRKQWFEVFEDLEKEHATFVKKLEQEIKHLKCPFEVSRI